MQAWYAAKTGYARSVAVSSIVGHVLGIGDRHGSNILVHEKSGEVVHIDFGIVFEQGKVKCHRFFPPLLPPSYSWCSHAIFCVVLQSVATEYSRKGPVSPN